MTRENILLEITTKNDGMLGQMALDMIENDIKKNDSSIVAWKREGQKIVIRSTYNEIMDVINTKRLTRYQKSVIQYTRIEN